MIASKSIRRWRVKPAKTYKNDRNNHLMRLYFVIPGSTRNLHNALNLPSFI